MRTLFSLAYGIFISSAAVAQGWQPAQVPKPVLFTPAMTPSPVLNGNPVPASINMQTPNSAIVYENEQRRLEVEQRLKVKEQQQIQDEVNEAFGPKPKPGYAPATRPSDPTAASYLQAYNELNDMLTGKRPANLKRAVFLVENAYYENKLDYTAYCKRILDMAAFCRQKMKEEKADTANVEAKNNMVFRLLSEPLTVTDRRTGKKITSTPLHYDFDDFYGQEDWSKMFVTKLLNTGFGQCHSMPLLFVILSQEMGAEAYLSFAPSHCFAKYRSGKNFKNVELTNGHLTSDAWVLVSGMVKAEALKSKIYLDTVGRQRQVAYMMQDLAAGYLRKFGSDYFVGMCNETGLRYYPNDAYGLAVNANYITDLFKQGLAMMPDRTPQEVLSNPSMKQIHAAMLASYADLEAVCYAEMHPEQYEHWIESVDKEKRKEEYEFFLRYQKTHKPTIKNVSR